MSYVISTYQKISDLLKKREAECDETIDKNIFRFLSTTNEVFLQTKSFESLERIVRILYSFERDLKKKIKKLSESRHVLIEILTCEQRDKASLFIGINLIHRGEIFHQDHVLKAINQIMPGIRQVHDSLYIFNDQTFHLVFIYLEMEKTRGRGFTESEIIRLKKLLPEELKMRVERLSPSCFLPRNEEEIFRNILYMSHELKSVNDLPQIRIAFQEQNGHLLHFSIVVLRVLKGNNRSWKELSTLLPPSFHFVLERVSTVGKIRKKYPKEACVFTLEVESALFQKKDYSIDLRHARDHVAKALKLMIGDFRDYNGGLYSKQNEQFEVIKNDLGDVGKKQSYLIERLFYSLYPSHIQAMIIPKAGKALISLFLQSLNSEIQFEKTFLFLKQETSEFIVAVIKTRQSKIKAALLEELQKVSLELDRFGHTTQSIDGFYYICFIHQYPSNPKWLYMLESILADYGDAEKKRQLFSIRKDHSILKINFQDGDPQSLNPHIGIDLRCRSLQKSLFEGLTRLNPSGVAIPASAEKIAFSSSKKHYVFHLRKHYWSNGEEVTAYHYERTWKKAVLPTSACLRPDLFYLIKNAKKIHQGYLHEDQLGVQSLDRYTLKIDLEYPSSHFLELLALPTFFPLYEDEEEPSIFNGPFLLRSWIKDHSVSLTRNPYYWDAKHIFLSGIDITIIADTQKTFHMFEQKELDWIGDPFSNLSQDILHSQQTNKLLKSKNVMGVSWLYCNTQFYPLSSSKIRRALAYAINREEICNTVFLGQLPSRSPLPQGISLLSEEELYKDGDGKEARRLFAEGCAELQIPQHQFPKLVMHHSHISGQKKLAQCVKAQWKKTLGIDVEIIELVWPELINNFDKKKFQIGGCYRHFFYRDPLYVFNLFQEPTNVHNASGWGEHEPFQKCVKHAIASCTDSSKKKWLRRAEKILLDEMPVIPTHSITSHYLSQDYLKGIHICSSGDVDFKWTYFERKKT